METWERQSGESSKAFAAFIFYRDMDEGRSYARVGQKLKKAKALIERWGSRYHWCERVQAYDDHMQEIRSEIRGRERIRMLEQQLRYARELQNKAHGGSAPDVTLKPVSGPDREIP